MNEPCKSDKCGCFCTCHDLPKNDASVYRFSKPKSNSSTSSRPSSMIFYKKDHPLRGKSNRIGFFKNQTKTIPCKVFVSDLLVLEIYKEKYPSIQFESLIDFVCPSIYAPSDIHESRIVVSCIFHLLERLVRKTFNKWPMSKKYKTIETLLHINDYKFKEYIKMMFDSDYKARKLQLFPYDSTLEYSDEKYIEYIHDQRNEFESFKKAMVKGNGFNLPKITSIDSMFEKIESETPGLYFVNKDEIDSFIVFIPPDEFFNNV